MNPHHYLLLLLLTAAPAVLAGVDHLTVGTHDFILEGGASFVSGHGAPTGIALRSGDPGQTTGASFPQLVLAPGATITSVALTYRYISGYGPAGVGHGTNLSIYVSDQPLTMGGKACLFSSPPYTNYSYSANSSNYSEPVVVHATGLAVAASSRFTTRLQIGFTNNDRNLQLLLPLSVNVTCDGADPCFVKVPAPPAPPPPIPPQPWPPATHTPWKNIGPWNIGDDIHNGGEAGTIAPAISSVMNPNLIYMGGNNNAASSGVLKTMDRGKHWIKVNVGLTDTRLQGLFMVDSDSANPGAHVLAGTPSGVFETLDGARTWTHIKQTQAWGVANSFMNGTINGKRYILIGANGGLGNVPLLPGKPLIQQNWSLIPSPPGHAAWRTNVVSVADFDGSGNPLANSVVGGCLWPNHAMGVVHIATLINTSAARWNVQLDQPCQSMAIDPNNADHFLVNNASNGAHVYESTDGGKTYHTCQNQRGAVMVAIDRQGWMYHASEGGAFRNMRGCLNGTWQPFFVRRVWRRTNRTVDRTAHDYQRINIDFAGGVAFGSDQGMFIKNGSKLQLYSANGDVNNNIIMHPSIAMGEAPNETCIVTALWDWSPVASWDSGKHWPSWQTQDDGAGMGYFGEGGGCFGVGSSKNVLCMHHHNVAYSSRCGKNMSRLVVPHGASVAGPEFIRKRGSRSEPSGLVYAPMSMGKPPWDAISDKVVVCNGSEDLGDLGVHTRHSCLSQADFGLEYNWYSGINMAVWRGDTDKHCHICKMAGNSSSWNLTDAKGAVVYALVTGSDKDHDIAEDGHDDDDDDDDAMRHYHYVVNRTRMVEWNLPGANFTPPSWYLPNVDLRTQTSNGNPTWVLKSWNFGANWTYILLPDFLQGVTAFRADPTNDTVLYGIKSNCIGRSYDGAQTWQYCWDAPGLDGSFRDLVIKDSKTMIMMRERDVPLRTKDGGQTWARLISVQPLAQYSPSAAFSWSGKMLALSTVVGTTVVWVSTDDGDTWVDESGDYKADNGGIAQWYEDTLFISSMGQGIAAKVLAEST